MNASPSPQPTPSTSSTYGSRWSDNESLRTIATGVVIACGAWWILGQLAIVLRPLLVAVFLAYILLPLIKHLRKSMSGPVAIIALAGFVALFLAAMAMVIYSSILSFQEDIPKIKAKVTNLARQSGDFVEKNIPWLVHKTKDENDPENHIRPEVAFADRSLDYINQQTGHVASVAANGVMEGIVAGLYLFFLLMEASRFPDRVKKAYTPNKANSILYVSDRITASVHGYLKAKSLSGIICSISVGMLLWLFGVKFVILWVSLTFLCNFIPYLGSIIAFLLPATFAGLMLTGSWQPVTCIALLLAIHVVMGTVTEPMLIGKAVGLSPIIILVALSLWWSIWGLPGMFLAVPLTMVILIVLDNIPSTRSIARLFLSES
jgi:AI-2 transport protein TqsA